MIPIALFKKFLKSMEIFQTHKGSLFRSPWWILPNFEPIQVSIGVLIACKNEDDPIENEGTGVVTRYLPLLVYEDFSRLSRAANSYVPGRILQNF